MSYVRERVRVSTNVIIDHKDAVSMYLLSQFHRFSRVGFEDNVCLATYLREFDHHMRLTNFSDYTLRLLMFAAASRNG